MRKRTNKLLAVLLTGAMAMSMGACGNGGASTDNKTTHKRKALMIR